MRPHDGRAIPTFLRQALQDKPLTVFGDGSQTRSFCYVDDQIDGLSRWRSQTSTCRSTSATPTSHAARAREGRDRGHRLALGDRLSRRCRSTTPRCASPTSPAPATCSAGSRRSASRTGCAGRSSWPASSAWSARPFSRNSGAYGWFRPGFPTRLAENLGAERDVHPSALFMQLAQLSSFLPPFSEH